MFSTGHPDLHYQESLTHDEQLAAQNALVPITTYVNGPILFIIGPFQGRTILVELHEIQKAELGRKFANRDRRPLDPPNVAEAVFYEQFDVDGEIQHQLIPANDIDVDGLVCHVDLFPVVGNSPPGTVVDLNSTATNPYAPPQEATKQTQNLKGARFVQAVRLPRCASVEGVGGRTSNEDSSAIYFAYPDLSVHVEGIFFFRYRMFHIGSLSINSTTGAHETPVMAETYGGLFRVYSTKDFPGLKGSTALTKHLSLYGIRVNLRENERKRPLKRKRSISGTSLSPQGAE